VTVPFIHKRTLRPAAVLALALLAGCATQIQDNEAQMFAPVFPAPEVPLDRVMPSGAIYSQNARGMFAADRRAAAVGDILTVDFSERFAARKSQSAGASRTSSYEMDLPDVMGLGLADGALSSGSQSRFNGNGSATQSNSLTGRVSVSVVRVLPGGNLEIMGQKQLTLNNGREYIRLTGVVRPIDISADNVVSSDRIAHAVIQYIGAGDTADTARQGWLQRATTTLSPF
jgi:flagellar L-ring protein FlgH